MPRVEAGTALYGVVGWPLRNTLSPRLHNSAFTALGLPAVYVPLRVAPERAGTLIEALETLGVRGANVTSPHKDTAFAQCRRASPDAAAARSVNTLTRGRGGWTGASTDGPGFLDFLATAGIDSGGAAKNAVVLGSGGAARSVAVSLLGSGKGGRVTLITRDPRRAGRRFGALPRPARGGALQIVRRSGRAAADAVRSARLVINATPLGSAGIGAQLPCPPAWIGAGAVAVDLVYGRETPWRRALRTRGTTAFSGLGMLIHQAARSFELWTGRNPLEWMLWTGGWEDELARSTGARAGARTEPHPLSR